jgi:energy-coupling factor transporter ATP-binding protein EcfA2
MTDPVTIIDFQAENFKRLKAVRISPGKDVSMVPITGKNGAGKSSVLDAIMAAIGGTKGMPSVPVRKGETEGAIRIELSNGMILRRTFDDQGGGDLRVESADGARYPSPQAVLDKLYSSVSFDPINFTRQEPRHQLAGLKSIISLDVDVDALAAQNKEDYDLRRDTSRELKAAQAALEQMPVHLSLPTKPIDETALETKIAEAVEHNTTIERRAASRIEFIAALERNREALAAKQEQLAEIRASIEEFEWAIKKQEETIANAPALPEKTDVSDEQAKLRMARETNQKIEAMKIRNAQSLLTTSLVKKVEQIEARMKERTDQTTKAFETATMPVKGLSFGDGEVLFDGIPLSQASTAQQLRISTAIGMAMAPDLKIMLVRDASLLDEEGFALLSEMAEEGGFQFWVESVTRGGTVGIILEDGEVQGAAPPAPIETGKRRPRKAKDADAQAAHEEAATDAPQSAPEEIQPEPSPEPEIAPTDDPAPEIEPDIDRIRDDRDERKALAAQDDDGLFD